MNILRRQTVSACMQNFQHQKVANSNIMQVYRVHTQIQFGSIRSELLMFLNWPQSICGQTIQLIP